MYCEKAPLSVGCETYLLSNAPDCQWRSKKGPPWRCKKGPLGGCGLVPVVNGRAPRATRRYPGGTENDSILRTVLRSSPNTREASRLLIPSTRHAAEPARTNPPDTSPRLPVRATLTEGYRRSHFGPPQPDQPAASVGDYCAAVLTLGGRGRFGSA